MNASTGERPPMDHREYTLLLTREALTDLDSECLQLGAVVRKAARVARLRQDLEDLFWLEFESVDFNSSKMAIPVADEIRPHFTKAQWNELGTRVLGQYDAERVFVSDIPDLKVTSGSRLSRTVEGLESAFRVAREHRVKLEEDPDRRLEVFDGVATKDRAGLCAGLQMYEADVSAMLGRIRRDVHAYLSRCESEIVCGRPYSQTFDRLRSQVTDGLADRAPAVVSELQAALEKCEDDKPEYRAQALLACRRALKALADHLYPATGRSIVCSDGKTREMSDDKYVNRLWQYLHERLSGQTYRANIMGGIRDTSYFP